MMQERRGAAQIDALTATRGAAAILVFIHHYGPEELFAPGWRVGNVAVSYFFVLSGFVLYLSYSDKAFRYADYMKRRVARIVPVYLLALALMVFPAEQHFKCIITTVRGVKELLLSAALLQAYVPTYPLTLNLPGWTISVEMAFYIVFPLLLGLQRRSIRWFAVGAAGLFVLSQCIHLYLFPVRQGLGDVVSDTIFFNPLIHMSQFMVGMLGGYLFYRVRDRIPKYQLLPLLLLAMCVAAVVYRAYHPQYISFQVGLLDPLATLLILSIAINNPAWLRVRPLVFLGEISYGIYILQWPVYVFLYTMNERHWHIGGKAFFFGALGFLSAFAALTYYLFELPLKRRINAI